MIYYCGSIFQIFAINFNYSTFFEQPLKVYQQKSSTKLTEYHNFVYTKTITLQLSNNKSDIVIIKIVMIYDNTLDIKA